MLHWWTTISLYNFNRRDKQLASCAAEAKAKRTIFLLLYSLYEFIYKFINCSFHVYIVENVEHCGGEPEQTDTGYYVIDHAVM